MDSGVTEVRLACLHVHDSRELKILLFKKSRNMFLRSRLSRFKQL